MSEDAAMRLLHKTYALLDVRELLNYFPTGDDPWPYTMPLQELRDEIGDLLFPPPPELTEHTCYEMEVSRDAEPQS